MTNPILHVFLFLFSVCSSMIIKHNVNKFRNLTNCSIIEGHLIIASMNENELMNYTFPMLREVTDYVIFYQAQNIAKLDHIFPNLAVIRGNKLVMVSKIFLSASSSCSRFYIFKIFHNFILLEQFYSFGITMALWNNYILLE